MLINNTFCNTFFFLSIMYAHEKKRKYLLVVSTKNTRNIMLCDITENCLRDLTTYVIENGKMKIQGPKKINTSWCS